MTLEILDKPGSSNVSEDVRVSTFEQGFSD